VQTLRPEVTKSEEFVICNEKCIFLKYPIFFLTAYLKYSSDMVIGVSLWEGKC
jgi:hypothetical protein